MTTDQDRMTEDFIREVISLFRKYGKVELRTRVGGNLARLVLKQLSAASAAIVGGTKPDIVVQTKRGGLAIIEAKGAPTYEQMARVLEQAPADGYPEEELFKIFRVRGRESLIRLLEPFKRRNLISGPKRTGKVRWKGAPVEPPTSTRPGRKDN